MLLAPSSRRKWIEGVSSSVSPTLSQPYIREQARKKDYWTPCYWQSRSREQVQGKRGKIHRKLQGDKKSKEGNTKHKLDGKTEKVAIFHHKDDNIDMNVVEKDGVVSGMLSDELSRCEEALAPILKVLSELPKGSLSSRKKIYKNKEYEYHYLKFREGNRVVCQHVATSELEALRDKLAWRKKYLFEARAYKKRIVYLKKILKASNKRGIAMSPMRRNAVLEEIERMVKRIVAGFDPQRIILFGSYARGTAGPDSDVDLLIIMNITGSKKDVTIQIDRALIDRRLPLDIVVASPEDVDRYRGLVGNVIRPALKEGKVLYERVV